MENTLSVSLMIAFLLIGAVGGAVMFSEETEVEVPVEVLIPGEIPAPVEIEVPVADASEYLNTAVIDFMEYVDDEELFTCDGYEYNFDEISISRVYDNWNLDFNDDDYTVEFNIKLEFDEDDERSCKETFEVESYYEEDEDVEFALD